MLWYCRFSWLSGTTMDRVRQRVMQQHAAGTNRPDKIRGWYNLAGGGAGFMLIEANDPREITDILEPYMDLVSWDVHAVYELPYDEVTARFHQTVQASTGPAASAGELKQMVRRVVDEAFNQGRMEVIDQAFAADFRGHTPDAPEGLMGPGGFREMVQGLRTAFPDVHCTIDEIICEGDRCALRYTTTGTHSGPLSGPMGTIGATGKPVTMSGNVLLRFSNGKCVEMFEEFDTMSNMSQLGFVPETTETPTTG